MQNICNSTKSRKVSMMKQAVYPVYFTENVADSTAVHRKPRKNPTLYWILWLLWGSLRDPLDIKERAISDPICVLLGTSSCQMQKFGQKYQKLSDISSFTCKPDLNRRKKQILASMSNDNFLDYLLFQEAKEEGGRRQGGTLNND